MKTFPMGGVHPSENKLSCAKPLEILPLPEVATIPLAQHIGAPAKILVKKGDRVKVGTMIADADGIVSADVHSPVSGEVIKVEDTDVGDFCRTEEPLRNGMSYFFSALCLYCL